jgi:hypothetical protein
MSRKLGLLRCGAGAAALRCASEAKAVKMLAAKASVTTSNLMTALGEETAAASLAAQFQTSPSQQQATPRTEATLSPHDPFPVQRPMPCWGPERQVGRRAVEGALGVNRVRLRSALFDYIEIFYNRERAQAGLGHRSPLDYEAVLVVA